MELASYETLTMGRRYNACLMLCRPMVGGRVGNQGPCVPLDRFYGMGSLLCLLADMTR